MAEPRTPDDNMAAQHREAPLADEPNPDAPVDDRGDGLPEGTEPPGGQPPSPQDLDPDLGTDERERAARQT